MVRHLSSTAGISLIESVMAIVVLGIAIPPLMSMFTVVARHSVDQTFQDLAIIYADGLMEEIVSKAFEDPDGSAGSFGTEEGSRSAYDDIDDYDGLSNSPPKQLDDTDLDEISGFTRTARVENVTDTDPDTATPAGDGSTDLKRVTVTVAWTGGKAGEFTLTTVRSPRTTGTNGPLDEATSAASAVRNDAKSFELTLHNATSTDIQIDSYSLSASRTVPDVNKFDAAITPGNWTQIWDGQESVPTSTLTTALGSASNRLVDANGSTGAYFEFNGDISSGSITFTLVLNFTDGTTSTLEPVLSW
ncbi:MAG: MSHA pilin protein MshD [Chlamydiales bacterium]|jgi:MSHA pilin protein MshD